MSNNPFDAETIRSGLAEQADHQRECIAFCRSALQHFNSTAKDAGTPVVEVERHSVAARSAGIAMASWPTVGGKARYYRILKNSAFDHVWTAADGQGLTQTEDGQLYYEGSPVHLDEVAAVVASMAGYDTAQAKQVFEAALRGEAFSYG